MPDPIELLEDVQPLCALIEAFGSDFASVKRGAALARIRQIQAKAEGIVEAKQNQFLEAYRATLESDIGPQELEDAATLFAEKERVAAEQLMPGIENLERKLGGNSELDPELQQAVRAIIEIAVAYLSIYQNAREAAIRLAADRRGSARQILRARPITGEIDHAALSQEFMARFPKIRAALAK